MTTTPLPFIRGRKARPEALPKQPKPEWLKVRAPGSENYHRLKGLMRTLNLHTVCEEANCPNIGECWHHGTATFMILGDTCTRSCGYCNVVHGTPASADEQEPVNVASAIETLALDYVVITSVVLDARPDVLNHNIETVPRLYRTARPGGRYERALQLLDRARNYAPHVPTKSGLMVGLGEEFDEVVATLRDLRQVGCQIITIGQYLRPSVANLPMSRYYSPAEFTDLKTIGRDLGFGHVESGPLVRSSYHAHEQTQAYEERK
jgi:lipoic acid synthetase